MKSSIWGFKGHPRRNEKRRQAFCTMASLLISEQENRQVFRENMFTIDRILGIDRQDQHTVFPNIYRPWIDSSPVDCQNRCLRISRDTPVDTVSSAEGGTDGKAPVDSYRRALNWYIGRRPRTAFSSVQVEILESVFQINSYPGIDVREQLAQRLQLDEDRIQIWFQNRRAKLKRSHRESQFLMVKKVFTDLQSRAAQ